jgi:hypothetical protein
MPSGFRLWAFGFLRSVNFPANMILLMIQAVLFMFCDMTTMPGSHISFFLPDLMIALVEMIRLPSAHITIFHFIIDAMVLIIQTMIHFCPTRMRFCKMAILCHGNICDSKKCYKKRGE